MNHVADRFNVTFESIEKPLGGVAIDQYGEPLPDDTLKSCYEADAVLLGAVGGAQWEDIEHQRKPEAGLLKLRKSLQLFANIRPAKVYTSFLDASSRNNSASSANTSLQCLPPFQNPPKIVS